MSPMILFGIIVIAIILLIIVRIQLRSPKSKDKNKLKSIEKEIFTLVTEGKVEEAKELLRSEGIDENIIPNSLLSPFINEKNKDIK